MRKPDDYPKAFEDSLDARAIRRMVNRMKRTWNGLTLAQARGAVEVIVGMIERGQWLDERDLLVREREQLPTVCLPQDDKGRVLPQLDEEDDDLREREQATDIKGNRGAGESSLRTRIETRLAEIEDDPLSFTHRVLPDGPHSSPREQSLVLQAKASELKWVLDLL